MGSNVQNGQVKVSADPQPQRPVLNYRKLNNNNNEERETKLALVKAYWGQEYQATAPNPWMSPIVLQSRQ